MASSSPPGLWPFCSSSVPITDDPNNNSLILHPDLSFPNDDFAISDIDASSASAESMPYASGAEWHSIPSTIPLNPVSLMPCPSNVIDHESAYTPAVFAGFIPAYMSSGAHDYASVDSTDDASHSITNTHSIIPMDHKEHPTDNSFINLTIGSNAEQEKSCETIKLRKQPRYKCKWEGCTYSKFFNRDADLMRHIKHVHVAPRTYTCYIDVDGCRKLFNRKDNLVEHIRTHQKSR